MHCPQTAFRRPEENNHVHTEIPFSDGSIMRIANTPDQLAKHLQVGAAAMAGGTYAEQMAAHSCGGVVDQQHAASPL
jgi:hypothetical protein